MAWQSCRQERQNLSHPRRRQGQYRRNGSPVHRAPIPAHPLGQLDRLATDTRDAKPSELAEDLRIAEPRLASDLENKVA